ncbi:MFS transporter [Actinoallomurus liliacearum]|uniref:MFS transporter n=1 Tax=Actinoallomurus liliacearum TaxID=1080073 RepID=UPI0031E770A1
MIKQVGRGGSLRPAFSSAVAALAAAFVAVGSTIPLFNIYRAEERFTNADISMTVVAYSAATLTTLLVMGRLSNHLGRRPTSIASLGLLVLGCLLLLNVHDIGTLIAGRLLMGLGAGLAGTSLTSYVVDAAPARPAWLASVASSQTVMLGLAVGAIASGALIHFGPWPRELIYLVAIGLLLLSSVLIAISPETETPSPGAWRSLRPDVRVPARGRRLLPVAAAVFLATWATGAFYQAFVPALVEDQLRTRSPLVLGLVFADMAPSALAAPIEGRFTPAAAQRIGMIIFLTGWIGIITATATGTLALFIAATIVPAPAKASLSAPPRAACCMAAPRPTGHRSSASSTSSVTAPPRSPASSPASSPTASRYRRSPSDTAHSPSSRRCSLFSLHVTHAPTRAGAASSVSGHDEPHRHPDLTRPGAGRRRHSSTLALTRQQHDWSVGRRSDRHRWPFARGARPRRSRLR